MDLVPIQVFQEASCKLECCKLPKEINKKNHKQIFSHFPIKLCWKLPQRICKEMYLDLSSTKVLIPTSSILRSRRSFVQICFQNDARPFLVPLVVVVVVVVGLSHVHFLYSREFNNFGFLPIAHPISKYTSVQYTASYECNGRNQPALTTKLQISFFQSQPPFPYVLKIYQYCTPYTSTC